MEKHPPFERSAYNNSRCESWHYRKNLLSHTSFDNQELQFYDYGEAICASKGEYPLQIEENIPYYTIHFIVSGKAQYFFRNRSILVKKGSFVVIEPHESCQVRSIPPERLSLCKLMIMDTPAARILLARLAREKQVVIRNADPLLALFQEMKAFVQAPSGNIFQYLSILIYKIIAEASFQGLDFESRLTVQDIHMELECWPEHEYNLPDLAERCGLSQRNFEREFKKLVGCSYKRYLVHCRIGFACRLLKNTNYTLSEIASINNFNSAAHFCRSFKLLTGVTPSKFRSRPDNLETSPNSCVAILSQIRDSSILSANRKNILWHILHDGRITISELALKTSLHRSAIQKNIEYLKKNGYILRQGSCRNGYWKIIKNFQ